MRTKEIYADLGITHTFYSAYVKRFLDIIISLVAILVLLVFFVLFYILTALFLGFPVIFKQARPGKDHKVFYIYKFRTMSNKKDKNGNLLPDERRITWFGKIMRKLSIDELPQLFNILKGDMSIVGPRPRLVKDLIFYDKDVYDYYVVRPGLTGPTQVSGRNKNTWEQVFEKDIYYAKHITFWGDIKIFFKTFLSVFKSTGETHSNPEENKETKEQEYYYADYIRRTQKISDEQYEYGKKVASGLKAKQKIEYLPELHDQELFKKIAKDQKE